MSDLAIGGIGFGALFLLIALRVPIGVAMIGVGMIGYTAIAGVDSGGGAGVSADLKTFEAHGVWGTCAIVAVTAQNTLGVHGVETISPAMVRSIETTSRPRAVRFES